MKSVKSILLATVALGLAMPFATAADRGETLRAINLVENPSNKTGYGPRGELGPYQFRASTWRMHTQKAFSLANDRAAADEVAALHYEWIRRGLNEAGIAINSYNIALAWNCGLTAVVSGRIPAGTYQYAEQVSNLAESFAQQHLAEQTAVAAVATPPAAKNDFQVDFSSTSEVPHFSLSMDGLHFAVLGEAPANGIASPASHPLLAVN